MNEGETYTLTAGNESNELTLEAVVTSNGAAGGMGRMDGGMKGNRKNGQNPGNAEGEMPEGNGTTGRRDAGRNGSAG